MSYRSFRSFTDILEPRHKQWSDLAWAVREWNPIVAFKRSERVKPASLKHNVLEGERMQTIIAQISEEQNKAVEEVREIVRCLLDEIGFSKDLNVIRTLSIVLVKILKRTSSGLYVNEESIHRLKANMGRNPVIFVPSHRSYADFILMSYVLFTYELEIPAIAAGMDFHGMWGMGSVLRDTGAFFMRRQFANDRLYSNVFAEYVRELVINGDVAIEFFIEGTRSRSCKSLSPKFGLLSMILKPFFFGEVPDVTIVPINISYDRVLEEKLFANELLGVPKPRESTSGFIKALNIINENYGNIYFDFSTPISAKEYFGNNIDRVAHGLGPLHSQVITNAETEQVERLAYDIVHTQQTHCILTTFNLIAVILNNNVMTGKESISHNDLIHEIGWLKYVLEMFGAVFNVNYTESAIEQALNVHKNLIVETTDGFIKLVKQVVVVGNYDKNKLKGYKLSEETMSSALPLVQLQLYVNPVMHFITGAAVITLIVSQSGAPLSKDHLWLEYQWLRQLLANEFVINRHRLRSEFETTLENIQNLQVIELSSVNCYILGKNEKLIVLLRNSLSPFLTTYRTVGQLLLQANTEISEKEMLIAAQKRIEEMLHENMNLFIHPYSLALDTISTSLQTFVGLQVIEKHRGDSTVIYTPNVKDLSKMLDKLAMFCMNPTPCLQDSVQSNFNIQINAKL